MQGFPHPTCSEIEPSVKADFPFTVEFIQDMPEGGGEPPCRPAVQRHLLGNAMHVSQIGTWCLYWLGMSSAKAERIRLLTS
eukprot:9454793-Lingulodinium_polyedra.AAC.1